MDSTKAQNTQKQELLSKEQHVLVAEFAFYYGIEPEQITFFTGDPKPFFDHEASAVLVRALADALGVENEPCTSIYEDAIAIKNRITFRDGSFSSDVGIANLNETVNGKKLTREQVKRLATSRATRGSLVNAGIDLLVLHNRAMNRGEEEIKIKSNRTRLLASSHIDGKAACLIVGDDKSMWYRLLKARYGVDHSNDLSDERLKEWAAFVSSLVPQNWQKAA